MHNKRKGRLGTPTSKGNGVQAKTSSSRARGEEKTQRLAEEGGKAKARRRGVNDSGKGKSFLNFLFNFFNEGQNGPFNKLLGAPSISQIICGLYHVGFMLALVLL